MRPSYMNGFENRAARPDSASGRLQVPMGIVLAMASMVLGGAALGATAAVAYYVFRFLTGA